MELTIGFSLEEPFLDFLEQDEWRGDSKGGQPPAGQRRLSPALQQEERWEAVTYRVPAALCLWQAGRALWVEQCGKVGPLWSSLARTETPTSPLPQVSLMGGWGPLQARASSHGLTSCRIRGPLVWSGENHLPFTIQRRNQGPERGRGLLQIIQWVMGEPGFPTPTPVLFLLHSTACV